MSTPPSDAERWAALYTELHAVAHALMRRERAEHTLQTTALVHEAWMRVGVNPMWQGRAQFLASAAKAMRRILVDHARMRGRQKRKTREERVPLDHVCIADAYGEAVDLLALDAALDRLADQNALGARIVELRFFAGMTHDEIAEACSVSLRTVERNFRFARAHLYRDLAEHST
ncbi:MAG TPA: ECF-type sigma factor [Nannocystaceae bacterium]|nr:ECF-type sigma factor [Nannocystaceae bacterium]